MKSEKTRLKSQIDDTARFFMVFLLSLRKFKKEAKLKKLDNMYEICTSLSDKNGRICRHVKHQQRNDPKPDFPEDLLESFVGYIVYMEILLSYYEITNSQIIIAIRNELLKSVKQHSKGK